MVEPMPVLAVLGGADCERVGAGWLAQPVNAVSSLAYVAVGGWLVFQGARPGGDRLLFFTTGTAIAGVGVASAGYHGPQPGWAEPVHEWSIVWLGLVFAGHIIGRLRPGRRNAGGREATRRSWGVAVPPTTWAAAALTAYVVGRTGSPLCRPDSVWQPHAAWHVLSAAALGAAAVASRV